MSIFCTAVKLPLRKTESPVPNCFPRATALLYGKIRCFMFPAPAFGQRNHPSQPLSPQKALRWLGNSFPFHCIFPAIETRHAAAGPRKPGSNPFSLASTPVFPFASAVPRRFRRFCALPAETIHAAAQSAHFLKGALIFLRLP